MNRLLVKSITRIKDCFLKPGATFWIKWGVTCAVLLTALSIGGNMFILIGLGGALGLLTAVILDTMSELRSSSETLNSGNVILTLVTCIPAFSAFFFPETYEVILGCFFSSGLMICLLMKRLDSETGMNIQIGAHLLAVLAALCLAFFYKGPYSGGIAPTALLVASLLYIWLQIRLRDGAEAGLRGVWFLSGAVGLAIIGASALFISGSSPSPNTAFAGFATGLGTGTLVRPLRSVTEKVKQHIVNERAYRKF